MPFEGETVHLKKRQRGELEEIARSGSLPAGFVLRAKILLLLADGCSYDAIKAKLDTTAPTISHWKKRFLPIDSNATCISRRTQQRQDALHADLLVVA